MKQRWNEREKPKERASKQARWRNREKERPRIPRARQRNERTNERMQEGARWTREMVEWQEKERHRWRKEGEREREKETYDEREKAQQATRVLASNSRLVLVPRCSFERSEPIPSETNRSLSIPSVWKSNRIILRQDVEIRK